MAEMDDDYEGDLAPLIADLEALRAALGDSYRVYGDLHLDDDNDDDWQQPPPFAATQEEKEEPPVTTVPRAPKAEPAPIIDRLHAVRAALEANKALQQRLQRLITSVNRAQDQAVTIRDRIRAAQRRRQVAASAPHALSARGRDQDQFTGVSWFWSQPGAAAPPSYPGYSIIKSVVQKLPLVFPHRRWQEEERNALCDGVVQVVQERLLNEILTELEASPGDDLQAHQAGISLEEFEARQAPIRNLTAASPKVIEIAATLTDTEWAAVAHRSVHGRTGRECSLQWFNAAQPTINHEKFTDEEDARLMSLVAQYGAHSWSRIATELQRQSSSAPPLPSQLPPTTTTTTAIIPTNGNINNTTTTSTSTLTKQRTPLACMARHQQLLHATRTTQEFTDADRQRLIQIVNRVGVQWKRVAEEFGGPWDHEQLMHHWRRYAQRQEGGDGTTAAAPRRGKWSADEDEALLTAVALYGKKWSYVAKLVPGRSDVQCRERYANCLDPEVNKEPWSPQEDELLRENISNFTNQATGKVKWSSLAELIPGRTDYAVKKRWVALTNAESRGERRRGGDGGGRATSQRAGTSEGGGAGADEGAGTSNAVAPRGQSSGASNKKEPAKRKKQKVQQAAATATTSAPPPPEPPSPPPEPKMTKRGRTVTLPARLTE